MEKSRHNLTASYWQDRLNATRAQLRSVKAGESPDPQTVLALERYVEWLRVKALQAVAARRV